MNESLVKLSRNFRGAGGRTPRSFTLIELLVVMGVIGVLAVLTLMSMRAIANDARLASAKNTVKAVLDTARAQAMKHNTIVLVAFRPRLVGLNKQEVDIYTAKWTGESEEFVDQNGNDEVRDRFVPIPAIAVRAIPAGIKIAAPRYGGNTDDLWMTQAHLPAIDQNTGSGEAPGKMIAIMYGPDGTLITLNSQSDTDNIYVDFNNNETQQLNSDDFDHVYEYDEPFLVFAPFLAVYDDDEARELYDPVRWMNPPNSAQEAEDNRLADLTDYINQFADRLHFNRYTGVVMK